MDMKGEAKLKALKRMKDLVSNTMKDDIKGGLKKVSIASDSKEGLKEGIEKAKNLLGSTENSPGHSEIAEGESMEEDMAESPIDELVESCTTAEEIDEAIKKLQDKKASLSSLPKY